MKTNKTNLKSIPQLDKTLQQMQGLKKGLSGSLRKVQKCKSIFFWASNVSISFAQ